MNSEEILKFLSGIRSLQNKSRLGNENVFETF